MGSIAPSRAGVKNIFALFSPYGWGAPGGLVCHFIGKGSPSSVISGLE